MQLTGTQQAKLLEKLNALWKKRPCEVCQENKWTITDRVYELRDYNEGNMVVGGPLVPLVMVVCTNCGNTRLFNAVVLGLIDPATGRWINV